MTVKTLGAGRPVSSAAELDSGVYRVHGVAIGNGDVTVGKSGVPKRWTPEALEAAAESLEGQPIVKNHENRDVDAVIGQVTEAAYREDTGVVYEGELDDRDIAEKVDRGRLQVSPRVFHRKVDELELDEDEGVLIIGEDDIRRFDNLSIVTKGAAPSNSIDRGAAAALSQEQIAEEFDVELPEEPVETDEELEDDDPSETDGSAQDDVGAIVDEVLAELEAEDNDPSDDARQEDNGQSSGDADNSKLTMDNEELMERLEAEARLADAPANELTLVPEHEVEELRSDNEELAEEKEDLESEVEELSEAKEDLESEIEEMEDEIETVKEAYAEALAASNSPFGKETLMEKFSVEELRERYDDLQESDDSDPEELAPNPQSGDPEEPEEEAEDELSPEEKQRIEELEAQIETFENRGGAWAASAQDAREELEELRGE